ncbi:MAG: hypothetical protein DCC55_28215 [Chloroflexi bacterium]|nr:MAG: hypothetical protein DCC55_28215 [Chloroflexota bacterium]
MKQLKPLFVAVCTAMLLAATATVALAAKPGLGALYYEGNVVRTLVPPAASPQQGVDPLFVVSDGAPGQLGIAAVAPGDRDYHGGRWAFYSVTWQVEPYLLTSAQAVREAEAAGHVTVTRIPENDFKCPIQP